MIGDVLILVFSIVLIMTIVVGAVEISITMYYQLAIERLGFDLVSIYCDGYSVDIDEYFNRRLDGYGLELDECTLDVTNKSGFFDDYELEFSCIPKYSPSVFMGMPRIMKYSRNFPVRRSKNH